MNLVVDTRMSYIAHVSAFLCEAYALKEVNIFLTWKKLKHKRLVCEKKKSCTDAANCWKRGLTVAVCSCFWKRFTNLQGDGVPDQICFSWRSPRALPFQNEPKSAASTLRYVDCEGYFKNYMRRASLVRETPRDLSYEQMFRPYSKSFCVHIDDKTNVEGAF